MHVDCTKQGNTEDTATREINTESARLKKPIFYWVTFCLINRILRKAGRRLSVQLAFAWSLVSDLENVARSILVPREILGRVSRKFFTFVNPRQKRGLVVW